MRVDSYVSLEPFGAPGVLYDATVRTQLVTHVVTVEM